MAEFGFTQKWEGRRTKKFELWVEIRLLKWSTSSTIVPQI